MKQFDPSREHARVIEWSPQWDVGAPMPQVFSNGSKTFLIYLIMESDPNWDGTYVKVIDNTSDQTYPLALVEFIHPDTHRFGTVNDEAGSGHPLYNRGLQFYYAHLVENSSWINELKEIHKMHPYFNENSWTGKKHYLLFFHDEMFEIIAKDYRIEIFKSSFSSLGAEIVRRMNS